MKLRMLYFARLRERFGLIDEALEFEGATVDDLVKYLQARGEVWAEELAENRTFRIAVNQEVVARDTVLPDNAEVALFPPVTGG